jgi:shikimate kinase
MLIFLTGFMGSGKTYWGKLWAAANDFSFTDLDEAIEKTESKTVAEIFEIHGEDYFRLLETKMLHSFSNKENIIIACGGGTPCFHENMQWMNEHGTTVYISSTTKRILERVLEEKDKRPLLKKLNNAELLFFIEQKLKEREPFYTQAKIILDAETITNETFKEEILNN